MKDLTSVNSSRALSLRTNHHLGQIHISVRRCVANLFQDQMYSLRLATVLLLLVIVRTNGAVDVNQSARTFVARSASSVLVKEVENSAMSLKLTTGVIKQSYCDGPDPDLVSFRLLLRLTFTNVSKEKIILERGAKQVPLIKISTSLQDAIADRNEETFHNYITASSEDSNQEAPSLDRLAILQPGENYESMADVVVPVPRVDHIRGSVDPGDHYLQITVWTWERSESQAKELRTRWKQDGVLWSRAMVSQPMPFVVEPHPKPQDCVCNDPRIAESQAATVASKDMRSTGRSLDLYGHVAFEQPCEWHVVFDPRMKTNAMPAVEYVIDKSKGNILARLQTNLLTTQAKGIQEPRTKKSVRSDIANTSFTGRGGRAPAETVSSPSGLQASPMSEPGAAQAPFVVLADDRPEFAVSYSKNAQIRLAVPKQGYRIGELIRLETTLTNTSDRPIFLRTLNDVEFSANDPRGDEVDVLHYLEICPDATPQSFRIVQPGEVIKSTEQIRIGCNQEPFDYVKRALEARSTNETPRQDLFLKWGHGCLDVQRPGPYRVSVLQTNEYVVVSPNNRKTAVGPVKSNLLQIAISK